MSEGLGNGGKKRTDRQWEPPRPLGQGIVGDHWYFECQDLKGLILFHLESLRR